MATRDFDAMLAEKGRTRQTFRVGGQEFTVRARLPSRVFSRLIDSMAGDDVDADAKTVEFFNLVLIRQDRQRFADLLDADGEDDEDAVIDPEQLGAISEWLLEHYTGKRPANSDSSSPGASGTGGSPNVVSLTPRVAS